MRMTTEEILEMFPSMWMSGKPEHRETVQGRYYGDLPYGNGEPVSIENKYGTLDAVDAFVAKQYWPMKVYKYSFNHGNGYMKDNGEVIGGELSIRYGNSDHPYQLSLFNNHCGIYGMNLWVGDAGKVTVQSFYVGNLSTSHLESITRKTIDMDTIRKLFSKVKKDDEYGVFAKKLVECAEEIIEKLS